MKFIIVGLGNFGSTLALRLIEDGHEVIGVDSNELRVNDLQDELTHTLRLDSTNEQAISSLPLSDTDIVVISIGEDVGSSVTTTALFKRHCKETRIIARAISGIHQTILEAMNINEIIHPEAEFADQFANRLTIEGTIKSFNLDANYEIAQFEVPAAFVGKTVQEVNIVNKWSVSLITILSQRKRRNFLGREVMRYQVAGVVSGTTIFQEHDTLVLFGSIKDLREMMEKTGESKN